MARFKQENGSLVDTDKAQEAWDEASDWNGKTHISRATGNLFLHETLYKFAKGRYYLVRFSQWLSPHNDHGKKISPEEAAKWLLLNEKELPEDLVKLEDGPLVDTDKAQASWDKACDATGKLFPHETLLSREGQYYLVHFSQSLAVSGGWRKKIFIPLVQDEIYEEMQSLASSKEYAKKISPEEAAKWLLLNERELPEDQAMAHSCRWWETLPDGVHGRCLHPENSIEEPCILNDGDECLLREEKA